MSWFDIIIALLLLASFVRGIRKGLIMQLAGFAAIILGAIFAGKAAEAIEPFLLNTVNISRNVGVVISYILAFIVIVFGVRLIGNMLHGLFKALHISILNKILGAIVGVATGMVILSIFLNLATLIDPKEEIITSKIKSETYFYPKIQVLIPIIVPYLNRELLERYIPEQLNPNYEEEEEGSTPEKLHS